MVISAKYENGVFKPLGDVRLTEGTVVEVYLPVATGRRKKPPVSQSGIVGMWADRDDIGDGVDYVNKLRDNPRQRFNPPGE